MDVTSRVGWRLIAILLTACASPVCLAGEQEQVELMEKAVAQFERLNSAASAYAVILERVTDAQSAESVVNQVEPAAKAMIAELETTSSVMEAGLKQARTAGPILTPEYQTRAQAVAEKQPALIKEWQTQSSRYAKELNRIDQLKGLPARFWDVFSIQNVRMLVSISHLGQGLGQTMAPQMSQYLTDRLALYEKHGASKIVDIGLEGASDADRKNLEAALRKALGPTISFVELNAGRGIVITVAPVERFSDVATIPGLGQITEQDDARRRIKVQIGPVAATEHVEQTDDANARMISVQVVNYDEIQNHFSKKEFADAEFNLILLFRLASDTHHTWKWTNKGAGSSEIGPVAHFDRFCKNLNFAEIVEQDDAGQTLKIRIDASQLTNAEVAKRVVDISKLGSDDRHRLGIKAPPGSYEAKQDAYFERARKKEAEWVAEVDAQRQADARARGTASRARVPYSRPPSVPAPPDASQIKNYDELVAKYGKDRMVRVEVTNFADVRANSDAVGQSIFFAATEADRGPVLPSQPGEAVTSSYDPRKGTAHAAPVNDFDKFCKKIDFAEIIERNDRERLVKIKVDPAKAEARLAEIEGPYRRHQFPAQSSDASGANSSTVPGARGRPNILGPQGELPNAGDPDYHKKLCDLMLDEANWPLNNQAVDALLLVKPEDIKDKNVRKQIALNFRTLATKEAHALGTEKAIQGLVLYGGKYSVPILIDLLKREEAKIPKELFEGLATYPDARGAEAVAGQLASFFNRDAAVSALRTMGPVAEDALVKVAPSNDADVSLAAVKLLGEVGTQKSLALLGKAAKSTNPDVADAAKASIKAIRERSQKAAK